MIFITGDTHGEFERIQTLCEKMNTTKDDIVIILGDAGINYAGGDYDYRKKVALQQLPITIFCIHGNHERRPASISTYIEKTWREGTVYVEEEFPSLLFAKDGEVYDFDGKKTIVIGGAYSVDKWFRIRCGYHWFADEQPDEEIKKEVEDRLESLNWKVDIILTHTTPFRYMPVDMFLDGIDQSKVDNSTEEWLDTIEDKTQYEKWYCGHFHTNRVVDKIHMLFEDIREF